MINKEIKITSDTHNKILNTYAHVIDPEQIFNNLGDKKSLKAFKGLKKLLDNSIYGELSHNTTNFDFNALYRKLKPLPYFELDDFMDELDEHNSLNN